MKHARHLPICSHRTMNECTGVAVIVAPDHETCKTLQICLHCVMNMRTDIANMFAQNRDKCKTIAKSLHNTKKHDKAICHISNK